MKSRSCFIRRWKKTLRFKENSNNPKCSKSCSFPRSCRISKL